MLNVVPLVLVGNFIMKPASANSLLPSLNQKDSAVPSTAALPALWRKISTKQVKVKQLRKETKPFSFLSSVANKKHIILKNIGHSLFICGYKSSATIDSIISRD